MTASKSATPRKGWLARHLHGVRRRPRFSVCAAIFFVLIIVLIVSGMQPALGVLLAFDIATVIFLGSTVWMFAHSKTSSMRQRARTQDEGYWGFLLSSAGVSGIALVALGVELHASKGGGVIAIVLAACSLLLAWLFFNTIFALHYAHEFYGDSGGKNSGLEFPGTKEPDYWDFVYFAFVIGMTFQVSDVQISEREIRRVALAHAVIAFFFNVIIIALSVNVVAGRA
ncbi:MAG: DUF1345 domain-containing protein [Rhodanobacteraceae bacterium]